MDEEAIDKELEELRIKTNNLLKEKAKIKALTEDKRLAELLHKKLCHQDHIEACGWTYTDNWEHEPRKRYHDVAMKLLYHFNYDQCILFLNSIRGL